VLLLCSTEAQKNHKKRSIFEWVAVSFRTKNDGKKIPLNSTIKHTSVPKKLRSFLPLNQKASLVVPEEIETKGKWKEQFLSEFRFVWGWHQWNFTKKQQSNKPFCLAKRLIMSAKGFLSWNEEKRKRKQKEEKYVRFLIEETGLHLPGSIMVVSFVIWTWIFCHEGCGLCAAVSHCGAPCFLDLPAIYLAVGLYHKCRDVAGCRLAYMINHQTQPIFNFTLENNISIPADIILAGCDFGIVTFLFLSRFCN